VDAASSNASQFTGVSKRGSGLFQGRDSDVLSGGAADIFIPSEARGLQTGIESFVSVQALDDDLLRVNDDDIDSLFAEEPSAAAVGRRDRLALSQPAAGAVGNRNAAVSALFGPKSKLSAATAPAPAHDDDDDDLFGDIGASAATHGGAGAMTELNLQEYIAKQKSRCCCAPACSSHSTANALTLFSVQLIIRRPVRLTPSPAALAAAPAPHAVASAVSHAAVNQLSPPSCSCSRCRVCVC
jgi:hypothetical protein